MDAEMLRNVLTMLGTVLGAILVLMLVAKITSMVHVEADDARAPIDSMEASVVGKRTLVTQEDGAPKTIYYMTFQKVNGMRMELEVHCPLKGPISAVKEPKLAKSLLSMGGATRFSGVEAYAPSPQPASIPLAAATSAAAPVAFKKVRRVISSDIKISPLIAGNHKIQKLMQTETPSGACGTPEGVSVWGIALV